jgi:vancomycin resistance protein YoaR
MTARTTHRRGAKASAGRQARAHVWLARISLVVVTILLLSNLVAALLVAGYQVYYDGLIFPGVSVWNIDLGGMSPEEAAEALEGQFDYPQSVTITFHDGADAWPVTAGDLGVQFDVARTVQAAYQVGRHPQLIPSLRQQVAAWRDGVTISPVIVYDQRAAEVVLQQITAAINQPAVDATISVQGTQAVTTPGQIGRQVEPGPTLEALGDLITRLESGEVEVVVSETPPAIMSAEDTAETINTMLVADLQLYIADPLPEDPGPWNSTREALADMIVIDRVENEDSTASYAVRLDEAQLRAFLDPLAPRLARTPADARFDFDEETGTLTPIVNSRRGRTLDVAATVQAINEGKANGQHQIPLVFDMIEPAVPDTATAEELGITELVSSATTYFAGSSQERRLNVQTAASRFHGIVVAPGEEFSFNEHLGDVSVETGFEQALIIYNGRTIEGVGGGVCQVSTTAFQAAFYAGYPINERWPHGYWVGYYDSGEGQGMDATVYSPLVDLRFTNDTPYHMLIETDTNLSNLTVTFRFYSTSDGRTVQKDGPYIANRVPHGPPLYEESAELSPGQVKQVDYAVDGFDATVYRTVYRDGEVLYQDTFFSQYTPWQAVYQVPPGEIPAGARHVD